MQNLKKPCTSSYTEEEEAEMKWIWVISAQKVCFILALFLMPKLYSARFDITHLYDDCLLQIRI